MLGSYNMNRVIPGIPVGAMQTFDIAVPLETHWRKATCEEVQCAGFVNGFRTYVDTSTELGQRQAAYFRNELDVKSDRKFTALHTSETMIEFYFPAGQPCLRFGNHRVPLERDPLFTHYGGDWRGIDSNLPIRTFSSADSFVDAMHTALNKIVPQIEG